MILNQSCVYSAVSEATVLMSIRSNCSLSLTQTHFLFLPHFPMSLEEKLRTFRRWPGPSLAAGDLPGLYALQPLPRSLSFFSGFSDSPALFITPQDQQLLTDSLSVMHPCWVSLQSTTMCFANAMYKE